MGGKVKGCSFVRLKHIYNTQDMINENLEIDEEYGSNYQRNFEPVPEGSNVLDFQGDPDLFEKLVTSGIDIKSQSILAGLLSKDFTLSYYEDGDLTEMKWLTLCIQELFHAALPSNRSCLIGEYRSYVTSTESDTMSPLTSQQKLIVRQTIMASVSRHYRSREAFLLDNLTKVHTISEYRDGKDERKEKKRGLFNL